MHKTNLTMALAALALSASALSAAPAQAHISMVGALKSRGGDQKQFPCDGKKGDGPVYTFAPGTTITLSVSEGIPHPGYFRIAFDNDGDDNFVEPKSIKPVEASRKCPFDADDQCGESDFCNVTSATGPTVLWDNLDPHPAGGGKTYAWNVKLPDVECENCTLQVLQIMEDTVHGAYCPQGSCDAAGDSLEDIYHRCVDIKLVKGATNGAGATTAAVSNKGMQCAANEAPPTGGTDAGVTPATDAGATASSDAGAAKDAGSTKPAAKDAGSSTTGGGKDESDEDEASDDTAPTTSTKDAGTKKDAGKPSTSTDSDEEDADDAAPPAKLDDGGCSVAASSTSASGAVWSLLALGALLARRKRRAV